MSEDKQYILRGAFINSLGTVAKILAPVLTVLLARTFSQVEFGLFISLQYFTMTLSRIVVLGLDKGLVWFLPNQLSQEQIKEHKNATGIAESLLVTGIFSFLVIAACYVFLMLGGLSFFPKLKDVHPLFLLVCILSTLPLVVLHICAGAMEGIRRPEYKIAINQFLAAVLGPVLAIGFKYAGMGFISMPMGFTIGNTLSAILFWFLIQKHFSLPPSSFVKKLPRKLFQYSWPLGIAEIVSGVLMRADLWMILALLGPKEAAVYSVMLILVNGLRTVRQGFDPLVVPIVSGMNKKRIKEELSSVFSYATNMVTTLQIGIAMGILLFPGEILMLAGKSYAVEFQALAILLIGNILNGFFGLNGMVLLGLGKSGKILISTVCALIANVALNYVLIPRYGMTGAALGTVIVLTVQNVVFLGLQFRETKVNPYKRYLMFNGVFIVGIIYTISFHYHNISSAELSQRGLYFASAILVFLLLVWINRASYKVK